jgi:hypothetical protein
LSPSKLAVILILVVIIASSSGTVLGYYVSPNNRTTQTITLSPSAQVYSQTLTLTVVTLMTTTQTVISTSTNNELEITGEVFTTTVTTTNAVTANQQTTSTSNGLYRLTFNQTGYCSPPAYLAPWAVSLSNGVTIIQPPNATLPLSESGPFTFTASYKNYSMIAFSVPDGTYNFTLYPQVEFFHQSGSVSVDGSDVTIQPRGTVIPCAATT